MQCGINPFHAQAMIVCVMRVDVIIKTSHTPSRLILHFLVSWILLLDELEYNNKNAFQ